MLIPKGGIVLGMEVLQRGRLFQQVGQPLPVNPVIAVQAGCFQLLVVSLQPRGSNLGLTQKHLLPVALALDLPEMMPCGALSFYRLAQARESKGFPGCFSRFF